jgi:hypothetical protein
MIPLLLPTSPAPLEDKSATDTEQIDVTDLALMFTGGICLR